MTPKEMIENQILVQLTQAKAHIEKAEKLFDEWLQGKDVI